MLRPGIAVLAAVVLCGACTESGPPRGVEPEAPRVAVSLAPQAWLVERLAPPGTRVDVVLPPTASPETWAPSPAALLAVARADLYFAVGRPTLAFEDRLVEQAAREGVAIARFAPGPDPHPWLDPRSVREAAAQLAAVLEAAGVVVAPERLHGVEETIDRLEERLAERLGERRRDLVVVQHPAWSGLLGRHGVEELALERDGKEPEPGALIAVIERVRRERVPAIFVRLGAAPRGARLVAAETGATVEFVDPMARDWEAGLERAVAAFAGALR